MANELSVRYHTTGLTFYGTIRSAAARTMWNGSALEALTVANWATYDIALTETPAGSYFYVGDWPALLTTVGWYWLDLYVQVGGAPAINDTPVESQLLYWNGTAALPWAADTVQVGSIVQTGGDVGAKTGFSLASTGLDAVAITAPVGVASTFREMVVQVWRNLFKKSTFVPGTGVKKTYDDAGTGTLTTQTYTDDGTTQTKGAAS
jgi:hypothetical protein